MKRRAFLYCRVSGAEQRDGFGLTRQRDRALRYCESHGLTLDEQVFVDSGKSGYSGANLLGGELGEFMKMARSGRIPKGSILLMENLDRLTRMRQDQATALVSEIVTAGIDIHTVSPEATFTRSNLTKLETWLPLQVAISLAHEESLKKSDRGCDNWKRKRAAIAAGTKIGNVGPFWLELEPDRKTWKVIEERAAVVREMFRLATEQGYGQGRIAKELNRTHPDGPRGGCWRPGSIAVLLRSRSVLGDYVPCTSERVTERGKVRRKDTPGATVPNYYPPIIDEVTFYKAQAAVDGRKRTGGRRTKWTNLFGGLIFDTADGDRMVCHSDGVKRRYCSSGALARKPGTAYRMVPVDIIEGALLSWLPELKTADVLGTAVPVSSVDEWGAKLLGINQKIKMTQERAAKADDPTVYLDLLDRYGTERKEITAGLEAAKSSAATSAEDALSDAQGVAELLKRAEPDEVEDIRNRLRATLARLIDKIEVTVGPQATTPPAQGRRIGIDVRFRAGGFRTYSVAYKGRKWDAWTYRANSAPTDPPSGTMTSGTV